MRTKVIDPVLLLEAAEVTEAAISITSINTAADPGGGGLTTIPRWRCYVAGGRKYGPKTRSSSRNHRKKNAVYRVKSS